MCTVCGCGATEVIDAVKGPVEDAQAHSHDHTHAPGISEARRVQIERDILGTNDQFAGVNRRRLTAKGILVLNLVSSPGSGKTSLLTKTLTDLQSELQFSVIEGDQQTDVDAERIRATGAQAIQINTGKGCHLDAHQIGHAIDQLETPVGSVLMIENVGNLVCPAAFDLGEDAKIVVLSVTEGEDKPIKYPDMFNAAKLLLLNKVDLLPHLDFDLERCIEFAKRVNPEVEILCVSAKTGEGLREWYEWLRRTSQQKQRSSVQAETSSHHSRHP